VPGNWHENCHDEIFAGLEKCRFNANILNHTKKWKLGNVPIMLRTDQTVYVPDFFENKLKFDMKWASNCAIDVSAILCDAEGTKVDSVYYKNKTSFYGAVSIKSIQEDSTYLDIDLE
jgi:stress response protein SCP2